MLSQRASAAIKQKLSMAPRQLAAVKLLEKSLPDLRAEIFEEMNSNPVIERVENVLETPISEVQRDEGARDEQPDYPEDDYVPGEHSMDEEAVEKRQAFFDRQVETETLQKHLTRQLPLSEIPREDWPMAEVMIGDLNDNGYYIGSLADMQMAYGCTKEHLLSVLDAVMQLDPPGCGARTPQECLLAQMDALSTSPWCDTVRKMIESHLDDISEGRSDAVAASLGLDRGGYEKALAALRTLKPFPGRDFPGERDRVEYLNPELRAVNIEGSWTVQMDKRSLPEIKISPKYLKMLEDDSLKPEERDYIKEKIEKVRAFRDAISKRQETIENTAQAIFDRQQEFFEKGPQALRPLTEAEIAGEVGVDVSTISRTVRDKYVKTPHGTFELRRFFSTGIKTAGGEEVSRESVLARIKACIEGEDPSAPLSDDRISEKLTAEGFVMARRTVAKYRKLLGIPGQSARRAAGS